VKDWKKALTEKIEEQGNKLKGILNIKTRMSLNEVTDEISKLVKRLQNEMQELKKALQESGQKTDYL